MVMVIDRRWQLHPAVPVATVVAQLMHVPPSRNHPVATGQRAYPPAAPLGVGEGRGAALDGDRPSAYITIMMAVMLIISVATWYSVTSIFDWPWWLLVPEIVFGLVLWRAAERPKRAARARY
jgi:hypothetical protein